MSGNRERFYGRARGASVGVAVALVVALGAGSGCSSKRLNNMVTGRDNAQLYELALDALSQKKWRKARIYLDEVINRGERGALLPLAQLALADAYFHDGGLINLAEALSRYKNFLVYYPLHDKAPYAQFQVGMCEYKQINAPAKDQTQTLRALDEFRRVIDNYPSSSAVADAYVMIDACYERVAQHDFQVGRYYFSVDACTAAIGRFSSILREFPGFADKDAVYYYLGRCLLDTDSQAEAELYFSRIREEFPDSPYNRKLDKVLRGLERGNSQVGG